MDHRYSSYCCWIHHELVGRQVYSLGCCHLLRCRHFLDRSFVIISYGTSWLHRSHTNRRKCWTCCSSFHLSLDLGRPCWIPHEEILLDWVLLHGILRWIYRRWASLQLGLHIFRIEHRLIGILDIWSRSSCCILLFQRKRSPCHSNHSPFRCLCLRQRNFRVCWRLPQWNSNVSRYWEQHCYL